MDRVPCHTLANTMPRECGVHIVDAKVDRCSTLLCMAQCRAHSSYIIARSGTLATRLAPCAAGVYFVPAFSGLLAPHWRNDARGCLLGLSQYSDKRHIVRAVLEGIAFQVCDVLRAIEADTGRAVDALRVDGGATKNGLLMQMQVRARRGLAVAHDAGPGSAWSLLCQLVL